MKLTRTKAHAHGDDEDEPTPTPQPTPTPTPSPDAPVQPGSNEPGQQPPSVHGTSHESKKE